MAEITTIHEMRRLFAQGETDWARVKNNFANMVNELRAYLNIGLDSISVSEIETGATEATITILTRT